MLDNHTSRSRLHSFIGLTNNYWPPNRYQEECSTWSWYRGTDTAPSLCLSGHLARQELKENRCHKSGKHRESHLSLALEDREVFLKRWRWMKWFRKMKQQINYQSESKGDAPQTNKKIQYGQNINSGKWHW